MLGTPGQLGGDIVDGGARHGDDMIGLSRAECDITDAAAVERAPSTWRGRTRSSTARRGRGSTPPRSTRPRPRPVNATGAGIVAAGVRRRRHPLLPHQHRLRLRRHRDVAPIPEDARGVAAIGVRAHQVARRGGGARAACADHLIVRTSWLYGREGPNFVLTMLRLASERPQVRVVDDQRGAPTWSGHLAPAVLRLTEIAPPGTYHLTNSGVTTWYGLAVATIRARGLPADVVLITTAEYPTASAASRRTRCSTTARGASSASRRCPTGRKGCGPT